MQILQNIQAIKSKLSLVCKLIVVTKTRPIEVLQEVYNTGERLFGENRVQELVPKYEALPKDIQWHLIGHLQSNKVKYIAPFITCIHSVESLDLLIEINKQAKKYNRIITCLLQIYIAKEETKFGLSQEEALEILYSEKTKELTHILISGLMGMATNTEDMALVASEFKSLNDFFEKCQTIETPNIKITELSMGMSGDYALASSLGSTMVRVGSAIFI